VEHGSLFVSAMITAYGVYVTFGALSSDPSETCNSFIDTSRSADTWEIVLGIAFVAISITYIAYNMGESSSKLFGKQSDDEVDHLSCPFPYSPPPSPYLPPYPLLSSRRMERTQLQLRRYPIRRIQNPKMAEGELKLRKGGGYLRRSLASRN